MGHCGVGELQSQVWILISSTTCRVAGQELFPFLNLSFLIGKMGTYLSSQGRCEA